MAKTSDSIHVDLSPEDTFAAAADLSRYDEWLVLHDGWRSALPAADELGKGTTLSSVIKAKGTRVRFTWEVEKFDRPNEVALKGAGKGGVKAKLNLTIKPDGDGSTISFLIDLGGLPLMGPVGKAAALAVKSDIHTSLEKFTTIFG
ncbi:SRPBCC family protein [Gordonia sp. HY002]|uniref:type II toxin-antitoxin system Rv0910 family toxin n=1 Tax=Gordonia zhenghanii TaxID=2911516 RepID=UPI001EF055DB|nr:SRPBCC family protein [Gordonia zhenghanii]MCF8568841.1 SRPBCC family protein [Gordonia zhenghanii]MCF8602289.1 SRPBCC family protein [Gordonia zhenghanii]